MPISRFVGAQWRAVAAISIALFSAGFVAACGGSDTSDQASASGGDDCGFAYVFSDPIATSTAEQTIQRGLQRAEQDLNVNVDVTDGTTLAALGDNLRAAAAKECYRAIGTAFFTSSDALTAVARDYPDQQFFIEGGLAAGSNVTSYAQANEQGTYVAGAMAATLSKSGVIGIVLGDDSPPLKAFSSGFTAGAHSVNPDTDVITSVVDSFTDPAKAGAAAVQQAAQGADLIYPAAGSNLQIYLLGHDHGYQTIGSDLSDLASVSSRHPDIGFNAASAEDQTNYDIVKQYVDGTRSKASTILGLKDGVFEIPYVTNEGTADYPLPQSVIAAGKKAYNDLIGGKVTIPSS
jgi:basic membrane protein A